MKFLRSLMFLTSFGTIQAFKQIDISPPILEASTPTGEITSQSILGQSILSSAHRLEDDGEDFSWLQNFSLKFQGCHHIKQWNENADDEEDVKIQTYRLVRFRLCPAKSCSSRSSAGCGKGYGDYVVDMNKYIKAYTESKRRMEEYSCQMYMYKHCDCEDGDDKGDDFNRDYCEYDCFHKGRQYNCIDRNPYEDDEAEKDDEDREIEKYFEDGCKEFDIPEFDDDDNGRKLEEDEEKYYIGAYCADQGGKIYLGMFNDDTCSNFADKNAGRTTYKSVTRGKELPYSTKTMVGMDCLSCLEKEDPNKEEEDHDDGWEEEIRITDGCMEAYESAGKCESKMSVSEGNGPITLNENGCYFIEGIKVVRKDGIIDTSSTRPNKVVSFFIFLFAVSFVLLGAYIYYLRMKLGMKINLNS